MSETGDSEDVGRELSVSDLVIRKVVVIQPPASDMAITMWVETITEETVTFFAGEMNMYVINFIRNDQLFDDRGRQVRVYEYLGEI